MNTTLLRQHQRKLIVAAISMAIVLGVAITFSFSQAYAADSEKPAANEHIITLHDDGVEKGFITKKHTLREALADAKVRIDERDRTEPSLDEKLTANSYEVNVYRARPVLIRDTGNETKVITSYRTPKQIAKEAKLTLQDEDIVALSPSNDPIADGAAEVMTIDRAITFSFDFYGKATQAYTQASTVGDMLKEKGIVMKPVDGISAPLDTKIVANMQVRLWRNGVQTVTQDEDVAFETKKVHDTAQPTGYSKIETPGENGKRTVTYEVELRNGVEISRKEINSVVTKKAVEQVETVGAKPNGDGLTKGKGVFMFTDSKGVVHRETYYDLPMARVMQNCGMGGYYTVRADGAKVDRDGYIIIAAHLANYPRCSIVETSIGLGKVYDTGGFTSVHPYGFDLATDWSKGDGI